MVIQGDLGGGNTKPPTNPSTSSEMSLSQSDPSDPEVQEPPKKKSREIPPARYWIFTWLNYPANWESHFSVHQHPAGRLHGYAGGKETCPTTGTLHIQGWIDFGKDKKARPSTLKLPKQIHWAVMKGTPEENYKYCSKDGDYTQWGTCIKATPFKMEIVLSKWMTNLVAILFQEPNCRSIYWIWEPIGKAGKTTFQKWYEMEHRGEVLILSGKAHDMKNGIINFKEQNGCVPRTIMCNIPRSTEERFISWQGMEEIKDMLFYSGKYEGGMVNEKPPHFIMFANWEPETCHMSGDRWNIVRIPDGKGDGQVNYHDWRDDPIEEPRDAFGNLPYRM